MPRYADVKISEICDAIDTTLGEVLVTAGVLIRSQSYDELTEGMNDPLTLQIYPEEEEEVNATGSTQQKTFGVDPVIEENITIFVDFYARARSVIDEDMSELVTGIDAIRDNLKTQHCPIFGLAALKTFKWSWKRQVFEYDGPQEKYMGARFILKFIVF